ncbi:MAG TPA: hypothetical protein VK543_03785, partial [Puia sp.]|nr:hypothetical protein [Puia sp.]
KKMNPSYLISALNVLNESEINYKAARNKRLHVELALIKLCYLQQAIEWVSQGDQVSSKKKLTETAKPIAFRNIQPMELRKPAKQMPNTKTANGKSDDDARLIVDYRSAKPASKNDAVIAETAPGNPAPVADVVPTLGALSKIRQQFVNRQSNEANTFKPLTHESLQKAWHQYTQKLRDSKHSATQSFQRSALNITGPDQFEVITNNNLEQKFIEQEKRNLSDYLQQEFNNKAVSFVVSIRENQPDELPAERQLNKREQYQQMIEQYPYIKELRERLKLELDY